MSDTVIAKPLGFALPVSAAKVPHHPVWFHEIKHDGYRLMVIREGLFVRLRSRSGLDFTERYPLIVEAARKIRTEQFVVDGEAVLLNSDGTSNFDGLHSGKRNDEVQLHAFDILAEDNEDLRRLPLSMRKQNLARLLDRRPDGIHLATYEQGEIGPALFEAACKMGLEGIVSKNSERAYTTGRCNHWIKIKNREHPAFARVEDAWRAKSR